MKYLIEAFYQSIANGTPEPIPYREILLTARIMDVIFDQLREGGMQNQLRTTSPAPSSSATPACV